VRENRKRQTRFGARPCATSEFALGRWNSLGKAWLIAARESGPIAVGDRRKAWSVVR
jgi:hypothetical protein